jgi:prepilin-type N-terminal cleavage/methylation domain-containing protein
MKPDRSSAGFQSAFSLVEVLVVVGIIAVLASLLFPVLARAKESALRTDSAAHLHQIGLGVVLYASDYDEALPFYRNFETWLIGMDPEVTSFGLPTNSKQPAMLIQVLKPYVGGNTLVWFCTADRNAGKVGETLHLNHTYTSYQYLAFPAGYNIDLDKSFPLVTTFATIDQARPIFAEETWMEGKHLRSYWIAPIFLNLMPDQHILAFKIPR